MIVGIVFLSILASVHSKATAKYSIKKEDTLRATFIREFDDRLYLKPIFTIRSLSLEFADKNREADNINYKPSSNNFLGLGLYLFDIGLEVSFKLPQDDDDVPEEIFGETESFDFQTNIYARKWGADIAYQKYEGLYLEKPKNHIDSWQEGDPYPVREDLNLKYVQANWFYVFNNQKFSYRSPYIQADQQLKSQGSTQLGMFFSNFKFSADSSLIPLSAREAFPRNENITNGRITTIAVLPGYAYTLTWNNIYLNTSLAVGPGNLWIKFEREGAEEEEVKIRPVANVRAALGYNGDWFFGGITAVNQFVSGRIDNLDVNSNSANIKFFLGLRIK
ncbi:DUF4421 family protein, partial [Fulvivirga aurantia]|uniref:DUF4421 family protein n=1 Tax=Fulvivirga aurantia TaxID=2529383 RepID=UPI001CA3DA79